jgi:hypothetical protein
MFCCLKDLFARLPDAGITQIRGFTPAAWAKAKEKMLEQAAWASWQPVKLGLSFLTSGQDPYACSLHCMGFTAISP